MKVIHALLEIEVPNNCTISKTDLKRYVKDAIASHVHGGRPSHPLWGLSQRKVFVCGVGVYQKPRRS